MGVITKLFYRGEVLDTLTFEHLFLDMEENIHIHYRDLRIELSRAEFEQFVETFKLQSAELLEIIRQRHYQDGRLANSNQNDVRIWTKSHLNAAVKYHPQRLSIEKCTDGYHLHYRNYKLLLSESEFRQFITVCKNIDPDRPYAQSLKELLALFDANELDYLVNSRLDEQVVRILVADYHLPKIKSICKYIGLKQTDGDDGESTYQIGQDCFAIASASSSKIEQQRCYQLPKTDQQMPFLVSFLLHQADNNENNLIQCQVLDFFNYLEKQSQQLPNVALDYRQWLFDLRQRRVIFPFSVPQQNGESSLASSRAQWQAFLKDKQLYFVKPCKQIYPHTQQLELRLAVYTYLMEQVASLEVVEKIYLMGSINRSELGIYQTPFVYGQQAKLGSDIDILLEVKSRAKLPALWKFVQTSEQNSCDIYHLESIKLEDTQGFEKQFPNVCFLHHLIDAYVYIPGKSKRKPKQKFLKKFEAKLFYSSNVADKPDIAFQLDDKDLDDPWAAEVTQDPGLAEQDSGDNQPASAEQPKQAKKKPLISTPKNNTAKIALNHFIEQHYNLSVHQLRPMRAASQNWLYRFEDDSAAEFLVKIIKVGGNYSHKRLLEHAWYEAELLSALANEPHTVDIVQNRQQQAVCLYQQQPLMLFPLLEGESVRIPLKQAVDLDIFARSLAAFHAFQHRAGISVRSPFLFQESCDMWLPYFRRYQQKYRNHQHMAAYFQRLEHVFNHITDKVKRHQYYQNISGLISLHNHGDVTPNNFIIQNKNAILIDFQNAFYGLRLLDVIDAAFEFSILQGQDALWLDAAVFDGFIMKYQQSFAFEDQEKIILNELIQLWGLIKFIKEVRMIEDSSENAAYRQRRAVAIAHYLLSL